MWIVGEDKGLAGVVFLQLERVDRHEETCGEECVHVVGTDSATELLGILADSLLPVVRFGHFVSGVVRHNITKMGGCHRYDGVHEKGCLSLLAVLTLAQMQGD